MPLLVAEVLPLPVKSLFSGVRCHANAGLMPAIPNRRPAMIAMDAFMTFHPSLAAPRAPGGGATALPVTESLRFGDGGIANRRKRFIELPQNDLVIRIPYSRGSVTKTLDVSAVSSLFRNAPVMAVVLNRFFTYAIKSQPSESAMVNERLTFV